MYENSEDIKLMQPFARNGWRVELETKSMRKFAKISQSRKRPLKGLLALSYFRQAQAH